MSAEKRQNKKSYISMSMVSILWMIAIFFPSAGIAEPPKPQWVIGPAVVDLGKNLAQLSINEKYIFADAADTKKGHPTF